MSDDIRNERTIWLHPEIDVHIRYYEQQIRTGPLPSHMVWAQMVKVKRYNRVLLTLRYESLWRAINYANYYVDRIEGLFGEGLIPRDSRFRNT